MGSKLETSRIFSPLKRPPFNIPKSIIKSEIPKPFGHRDQGILRKSVRKRGRKSVDRNPPFQQKKHRLRFSMEKKWMEVSDNFPRIGWLLLIFLIHELFLLSRFDCWGMLNHFGWSVIWACPFSAHSSLEEDIWGYIVCVVVTWAKIINWCESKGAMRHSSSLLCPACANPSISVMKRHLSFVNKWIDRKPQLMGGIWASPDGCSCANSTGLLEQQKKL